MRYSVKRILKSIIHSLGYEIRALPKPSRYALFEEPETQDYGRLKPFTARAARFSASMEQVNAVRNFCLTGLLKDQPQTSYSRFEIGDERTLSLGVWRKQGPGKEVPFIRDPKQEHEWFYWADHQRIEPKRTRWRIALLGESVARGYFYDPHFNLATVLHTMLQSELGLGKIDVVDLAKSNLRMQELKTCIGQSLALSPDILVIFAGNNWHAHLSDSDIPYVESLLRQEGVPGMKAYLDEKREQATRSLVVHANRLLAARNIKIVWVIPEFNLKDWADPTSNAPLLPGNGNERWRELDRQMRQALHDRDGTNVERLAKQMTELDGGTSSVPLHFLAECYYARGDVAATRLYLEQCRDAAGWDPSFSFCPRVFLPIQRALREASTLPGNAVVDLPEVLSRQIEGELPGRRMFLDYCHMTADGINIAGAEIASHALSLIAGRQVSALSLLSKASSPPAEIEGRACFLAASHNAAFYQRLEIVKYFCDRALAFWPECGHLMRCFADYAIRDLPMVMCKSGLELLALDKSDARRYLAHGRIRRLDLTFSDAAVTSLAEIGIGIGDEIADLRVKEHSTRSGPKELTNFFYSAAIPALSERGWTSRAFPTNHGSHSIYSSAFWEISNFVFFAERGQNIDITFTYRVRFSSAVGETVTVDVNGRRVAELPAGQTWCTRRISVPSDCIVDGLNEILISWPTEEPPSDVLLTEAANSLLAMRLPYFFRVFGEIHGLSVSDPSITTKSSVEMQAVVPTSLR